MHHTSNSEQKKQVARWRQSDLSIAAYARSIDIPKNTFWSWTRRHPEEGAALLAPAFIDVTPTLERLAEVALPMTVVATPTCEVKPVSVRLQFEGSPWSVGFDVLPPPTWFAAVLREVASC